MLTQVLHIKKKKKGQGKWWKKGGGGGGGGGGVVGFHHWSVLLPSFIAETFAHIKKKIIIGAEVFIWYCLCL